MSASLSKGARVTLRTAHGEGAGMIPAGVSGVVTGVYPPDHFRPGEVDQDVVYVDFEEPGQPAPRTASFTLDRFEELFEVAVPAKTRKKS